MAIDRQRFEKDNPLQEKVWDLKKALEEMTANRDKCRAANETFSTQSFEARRAVEAAETA